MCSRYDVTGFPIALIVAYFAAMLLTFALLVIHIVYLFRNAVIEGKRSDRSLLNVSYSALSEAILTHPTPCAIMYVHKLGGGGRGIRDEARG